MSTIVIAIKVFIVIKLQIRRGFFCLQKNLISLLAVAWEIFHSLNERLLGNVQ
jgi:hypothetical protein